MTNRIHVLPSEASRSVMKWVASAQRGVNGVNQGRALSFCDKLHSWWTARLSRQGSTGGGVLVIVPLDGVNDEFFGDYGFWFLTDLFGSIETRESIRFHIFGAWTKESSKEESPSCLRSLAGVPCCCESTAPTPVVEASTSITKGLLRSGWMRSGAEVNAFFSASKASVAAGDQDRDLGLCFSILVSGLVMEL